MFKFVGIAAIAAIAPVAASQTQAKRSQPIRAAVVILENARASLAAQPLSAAPHVWYNLQASRIVKPASWNIFNPNATSVLTAEARLRWNAIDPSGTPAVGTRLTKQHAPYWEIFLSQLSEKALADYDVLLVNPRNLAQLTPSERERLRRFVDQGGLLWIDTGGLPSANGIDPINNFPYSFKLLGPNGANEVADFTQPLLSIPHPLGMGDINLLSTSLDSGYVTDRTLGVVDGQALTMQTTVGSVVSEFARLRPAVVTGTRPTISIGRIGDGVMVITSRGASLKLNRPYGASMAANTGFLAANPVLDRDGVAAAKLAVNMISMLTSYSQGSGGSRKTGSSAIDVNAPLIRRSALSSVVTSAPTIYKGMVVATVGDKVVVYDADPQRDLDGDGNPDDGLRDLTNGTNEDVVWMSTAISATPLSTPVCVEVPDANVGGTPSIPRDQVLVVDSQGTLHAFNMIVRVNGAFEREAPYGQAQARGIAYPPIAAGGVPGDAGSAQNSPTVHEGFAYLADWTTSGTPRGRIRVVNLAMGMMMDSAGRPWSLGGGLSPVQIPQLTASPTVGNIPIADNSGGVDRVLYAPFAPNPSGVPSAGFISIWLGAKGEKPSDYEPKAGEVGNALIVTTRASQQGGLPIFIPGVPSPWGVKLTLLNSAGKPFPISRMAAIFNSAGPTDLGGGVLSFPFNGTQTFPADVASIRIDYTIDIGTATPAVLAAIERGRINLPDSGNVGGRRVLGPVALSPGGTVWVTSQHTNPARGGGVYGFREEGRGLFKMTTRWETFEQHLINRNGGERITYPGVLYDNDPWRLMIYEGTGGSVKFGGVLNNYRIVGPPVIRNGQTFVSIAAREASQIPGFGTIQAPVTVVMSFRAESEVPQIQVGDLPDGTVIIQPDMARSTATNQVPSTLAGANFAYDRTTGRLRFDNLATIQKGVIQNSISLSQPIVIRKPGQPDQFIEPDTIGGAKWNPVLWYSVFQGLDITPSPVTSPTSPLVATGDTLFIAGQSMTPRFLSGSGFSPVGLIQAIRTDVSPGNAYLQASDPRTTPAMSPLWPTSPAPRPWLTQFSQLRVNPAPIDPTQKYDANPGFLWPQLRGVRSMQDYLIRLNQSTLVSPSATSQNAKGVVAGDGALIAWGDGGLFTFSQSDFVVVDEGRIGKYDPAGNVLQAITSLGTGGAGGSASGNVRPLVKPTRAYRTTGGGLIVVDTGSNRISLLDSLGNELRGISEFNLDPVIVPAGYIANEPLTLNAPRDVLTFTSYRQRADINPVATRGDGGAYEYWVHYLIADSGNKRLVEIVDRYKYNANTGQIGGPVLITGTDGVPRSQVGVLVWHSPSNVNGKDTTYTSISRTWLGPIDTGRFVYVAGLGGGLPTRVDTGLDTATSVSTRESRDGNGGVAIFDPLNSKGTQIINRVQTPAYGANVFWNYNTGTYNSPARAGVDKFFENVSSVTVRPISTGLATYELAIMVADSSGLYEMSYTEASDTDILPLRWLMPNQAYMGMRPGVGTAGDPNMPLRATFARRLDNGDVLVVNGFYGKRRNGTAAGGEILQLFAPPNAAGTITAPNMGFGLLNITFELPPVEGSRGLVLPVFADRK